MCVQESDAPAARTHAVQQKGQCTVEGHTHTHIHTMLLTAVGRNHKRSALFTLSCANSGAVLTDPVKQSDDPNNRGRTDFASERMIRPAKKKKRPPI